MATDAYLTFLGLGLIMIVADGQILYHSGRSYLSDIDDDSDESVGSMTRLLTVLFHLVMLGFLALLSVLDLSFGGESSIRAVVGNLGVLLLLLALVHAVTMAVMSQIHDSRSTEEQYARTGPGASTSTQLQRGPVVTPVAGQPGRSPRMSQTIEEQQWG